MFAVLDLQGRVIAFSGRALSEPSATELGAASLEALSSGTSSEPAKYVNSPESPIYQKRQAVFGLYQARQSLRETESAIVVEGNFDVVSLHARGIKGTVAPLGTAFTSEQARQIKRFAPSVTLLFDGDGAGRRAVRASRLACREAGLLARVAVLPEGQDPDELVRGRGADGVRRIVGASQGMLEYLIDSALDEGFSADDSAGRAAKIREVAELLAEERDATARAMAEQHANRIAERLGSNDARTFRALAATVERALTGASQPTGKVMTPSGARSRDRRAEIAQEIFGALLDYPSLLDTPEVVDAIQHVEGEHAAAIAALRQSWRSGHRLDHEQVLAKIAPPIHPFALARLAAPRHDELESARAELFQNVKKLQRLTLSRQKGEVLQELERAQRAGDFEAELVLLREHQRRARERHDL
jgi:DNA primase